MKQTQGKPYDLAALSPDELEALVHKRPDLRKEIFDEANRRWRVSQPEFDHFIDSRASKFAQDAMTNEGGK